MDESLIIAVQAVTGVQDRMESQRSDGMDGGETKDPPPREW
jgi:hypothetical protein